MAQIILTNIQKEISGQKLFTIKHLQARQAARIGIVGKNGGGKTTLLRMLTGKDTDYDGEIDLTGSCYLVPQLKENTTQSGGEQVRAYLNQALKARPEILLLDEPSANLDRANQEWLINKLKRYPGIIVFVTHDRHLLTELATSIWEIENQVYTEYPVNYQTYLEQKRKNISRKKNKLLCSIRKRRKNSKQRSKNEKIKSGSYA
ncbi:ATP-binding cassette domain-containing protein [Listeria grayi]|uniref:ABC transporter, ATP-binding protein n=1 Tax=Listeria grayi FSL F6-1183 TaxID=1265827 RepID=A0A829R6I2_LISGR|nr:ATP-binding cassette domain-containing protein [Listeria grayi]EUJ28308.1 ABC transporter, ATP-binding protein [Listeria grayi FSL F6-1183]